MFADGIIREQTRTHHEGESPNGIMASIAVGNTCATASGGMSDGSIIVLRQLQNSSVCTLGASFSFWQASIASAAHAG